MTRLRSASQQFRRTASAGLIAGLIIALPGTWPLVGPLSSPALARAEETDLQDGQDGSTELSAEQLSAAFRQAASSVQSAVVRIRSYTNLGRRGLSEITGSGFVIRSDGYLLTNNHVVESAVMILAEFADGQSYPAQLVGTDALTDLAVVRIDQDHLPPLRFSEQNELRVGDWVIAIGFPLGLDQTVTAGIVSATNRHLGIVGERSGRAGYEAFIQTDAAINKGNSGGPLLNLRGQVVGVNAAIVTQTGGSDGLGFAVPTSLARYISSQLIEHGRVRRGYLGVGIQDLDPVLASSYGLSADQHGVLLTSVDSKLAAGRAGLEQEDIVTAINGEPVYEAGELRNRIAMMEPGTEVTLQILRNGVGQRYTLPLGELPNSGNDPVRRLDPSKGGRLGFRAADLADYEGVRVRNLVPGGSAHLADFRDGDIIIEVNGRRLGTIREGRRASRARWLLTLIDQTATGDILRFTVQRRLATRYIAIEMP